MGTEYLQVKLLLSEAGKSIIFGLFFFFSNEWVPNNSSDHLLTFALTNAICLLLFLHQLLALDI